jgi:hypothetical protein
MFRAAGQTKPRKNISKIGFSWMKETLDFSFFSLYSLRIYSDILLFIFIGTTYVIIFSIRLFSKFFCRLELIFCFTNPDYHLIRTTAQTNPD